MKATIDKNEQYDLPPCPSCGWKPTIYHNKLGYWAECSMDCHFGSAAFTPTGEEAADVWLGITLLED